MNLFSLWASSFTKKDLRESEGKGREERTLSTGPISGELYGNILKHAVDGQQGGVGSSEAARTTQSSLGKHASFSSPAGPVHIFAIRRPQKAPTQQDIYVPRRESESDPLAAPNFPNPPSFSADQVLERISVILKPSSPIAREVGTWQPRCLHAYCTPILF